MSDLACGPEAAERVPGGPPSPPYLLPTEVSRWVVNTEGLSQVWLIALPQTCLKPASPVGSAKSVIELNQGSEFSDCWAASTFDSSLLQPQTWLGMVPLASEEQCRVMGGLRLHQRTHLTSLLPLLVVPLQR